MREPEPSPRYRLDDFNDIPDLAYVEAMAAYEAERAQANGPPANWQPIDLTDPRYAVPPDPPAIQDLLYTSKRHVISGPPETAKTLIAYVLLLQAHRAGHPVAIIDFEMGPAAARTMLVELGCSTQELAGIYYVEPDTPPTSADLTRLIDTGSRFVLIDAAVGAYDASNLDDNKRSDVERWARQWIRPLWDEGIATIVIDHVVKQAESRGKYMIGSERKLGGADVHLSLESIKTITRGGTGLVKVVVHKDRPGFLDRPTNCYFELTSDPVSHQIAWKIRPHDEPDESGHLRPTVLMERVSQYLETKPEPVSRNNVETSVNGKSVEWIRRALDTLIREDYASEETGPRRARLVSSKRPYRQSTDPLQTTSSDFVPTSSGRTRLTSSVPVPPQGAGTKSRSQNELTSSTDEDEVDVYDPDVQRLIDQVDTGPDIPW